MGITEEETRHLVHGSRTYCLYVFTGILFTLFTSIVIVWLYAVYLNLAIFPLGLLTFYSIIVLVIVRPPCIREPKNTLESNPRN